MDIPKYVTEAFETVEGYSPIFDQKGIKCMVSTDIEIYSVAFSRAFEYYQATTYLNTNYNAPVTLKVIKL